MREYRVKARNTAEHGENRIHEDAIARQYGFRGGLVPGVTVYAYLTYPLVAAFGPAWLERGTASVRFAKPILDGEEVLVTPRVDRHDAAGMAATLVASTQASGACATLEAALPAATPTPINLALYAAAPLPAERPEATRGHFESIEVLGTPEALYDEARAAAYADRVSDPLSLYRGPDGWVHPGFLIDQANRAIDRNVRLGPWIHTGSVVRHLGGARIGERLATRGRVRSLFERKGRELVEVDLAIVAGDRPRPVAHVLHTAIYRLPPPSS
jgi:hypothetical protein